MELKGSKTGKGNKVMKIHIQNNRHLLALQTHLDELSKTVKAGFASMNIHNNGLEVNFSLYLIFYIK